MKTRLNKSLSILLVATLLGVVNLFAAPYEKGEDLATFNAEDQHGAAFAFDPAATKYILVSHDMDTGKKANAVLTTLGKEYLTQKQAVYLANIDGMPAIGRMFAIPKMRKYAHRIILGDDAALIARFPQETGKVTVITLAAGKIQSISYWTPGVDSIEEFVK